MPSGRSPILGRLPSEKTRGDALGDRLAPDAAPGDTLDACGPSDGTWRARNLRLSTGNCTPGAAPSWSACATIIRYSVPGETGV